jgi:hypothetical protein
MRNRFLVIITLWGLLAAGPGLVEAASDAVETDITTSIQESPTASFIEDLKNGHVGAPEHSGHNCVIIVNRARHPDVASTKCARSYVRTWMLCRDGSGNRGVFKDSTRNAAGTYSNASCSSGLPYEVSSWYETSH